MPMLKLIKFILTASGPTSFCSGGSVSLTANSGSSYLWSSGQTIQSLVVNTSGNYIVTVTNAAGNSAVSSPVAVTVKSLPVATITSNSGDSICPGNAVLLTAGAATTYAWSNGATTQTNTVNTAGTYTVVVTNANNCSAAASMIIRNGSCTPLVSITPNGPLSFCTPGSVTLSATTNNGYLWSNGATSKTVTVSTTGSYTVTVSNIYGITATSSVYVEANPTPTVSIASSNGDSICPGSTIVLTASSTNAYLWSTGSVSKSIVVSSSGTYTVTVTTVKGCSAATSFQVNQGYCPPDAVINTNGPTTICSGNSLNLIANTAAGYLWSTGATTQYITVNSTGIYAVTVSDIYGQTASTSVPVTVNPNPSAAITSSAGDTLCPGTTLTLQGSPSDAYLWSDGSTTGSIVVSMPGTYELTVTNANGCTSSTMFTAVQGVCAAPVATITASGKLKFCNGESVTLSALPGYTYLWNTGATTQSIVVTSSGSYVVTVTNWAGVSAVSATKTVKVYQLPTASITSSGPLNICAPNTVTLTAFSSVSYLWSNGATTQSIVVSQPGSYVVTVTNQMGCSNISSPATVTVGNCNASCPAPYNLITASITSSSARIRWEKTFVSDSINYVLTNINTGVSVSGNVKGTPRYIDVFGLAPSTPYKWSLRQLCNGGGISVSTDTITFITKAAGFGTRSIDNEVSSDINVKLFPNPAVDVLNIGFTSSAETTYHLYIRDFSGKLIISEKFDVNAGEQVRSLNLNGLAGGIYFVELENKSEVNRLKFIKQD